MPRARETKAESLHCNGSPTDERKTTGQRRLERAERTVRNPATASSVSCSSIPTLAPWPAHAGVFWGCADLGITTLRV